MKPKIGHSFRRHAPSPGPHVSNILTIQYPWISPRFAVMRQPACPRPTTPTVSKAQVPPHKPLGYIDVPGNRPVGSSLGSGLQGRCLGHGALQFCQPHFFRLAVDLGLLVEQPHGHLVLCPAMLLHQCWALLTPVPHRNLGVGKTWHPAVRAWLSSPQSSAVPQVPHRGWDLPVHSDS